MTASAVAGQTNAPVVLKKAKAKVAVAKVRSVLHGRSAIASVTCSGVSGTKCKGTATFTVRVPVKHAGKRGKTARAVKLGRRRFSLAAGEHTRLTIRASHKRLPSLAGARLGATVS